MIHSDTRYFVKFTFWMLLMSFGLTSAAFAGWIKDTQENTLPSVSHADSPHVRITIADGEAAVTGGDEVSARERAKNGAVRAAIEKVLGVYIEANSRGEDYVEVKDELTDSLIRLWLRTRYTFRTRESRHYARQGKGRRFHRSYR